VCARVVLLTNVCWIGYVREKYGIQDGYGTIQTGDCEMARRTNTWLHFLINILSSSTALLNGSNAFMTAYSGPSREEVDKAHSRGRFLHIGSFSLGNLRKISKGKGFVVLLLACSSVPFHLL
jgi:hypothetical protein